MIQPDNQLNNGLISMLSGLLQNAPQLVDQPGEFADRLAAALAASEDETDLIQSLQAWMPEVLGDEADDTSILPEDQAMAAQFYEHLRELLAASRFRQQAEDGEIMPLAKTAQLHSAASVELGTHSAGPASHSSGDVLAQAARQANAAEPSRLATLPEAPRLNSLSEALSGQLQARGKDESRSFEAGQNRFSELLNARSDAGLKNEVPAALRSLLLESAGANREPRAPESPTAAAITGAVSESQRPLANGGEAPRLPVAPGQPQFANALGEQIRVMVSRGVGQAVIRLDPPHLGSLEIRMRTEGEHTKVQFIAQTPAAREALEQALPRLRELFSDQGQKIEASVSERDERAGQQNAGKQGDGEAEAPPDPKYRLADSEAESDGGESHDSAMRSGLLDAYA